MQSSVITDIVITNVVITDTVITAEAAVADAPTRGVDGAAPVGLERVVKVRPMCGQCVLEG